MVLKFTKWKPLLYISAHGKIKKPEFEQITCRSFLSPNTYISIWWQRNQLIIMINLWSSNKLRCCIYHLILNQSNNKRCHDLPKRPERTGTDWNVPTKIPKRTARITETGLNKGRVGVSGHDRMGRSFRLFTSKLSWSWPTYLPTTYLHIHAFLPTKLTFITLHHLTYRHTYLP